MYDRTLICNKIKVTDNPLQLIMKWKQIEISAASHRISHTYHVLGKISVHYLILA